jgi:PAS domain S-box-containing protein
MFDKKQPKIKTRQTSTKENSSASIERGILFQDEQGYVRAINPTAADILGLSAEQLIGCSLNNSLWQTINEDGSPFNSDHPAIVALSTGKPCSNVVMSFYQPNGKLIWLLLDSQPLFQNDQTLPYGVITTFAEISEPKHSLFEITLTQNNLVNDFINLEDYTIAEDVATPITNLLDRQEAEVTLREENQRIITAWESMTDAYVSLDREWRLIYANKAASLVIQQLTDLEPQEFFGKSHWELFPSTIGQEIELEYRRAVSEQIAVHLEVPYEGNWFEVHAYPSEVGLSIYFRDISDRKLSEEALTASEYKYRTMFEAINDGFCVCEMLFDERDNPTDYRFLEVNPVFEQMTGLTQAEGKTARELVPNLEDFWIETYGRVVLTGEPVRFENQSLAMNRWFDVKAFPVGEPQSHKFGILFTNITDRKQIEENLRESEERFRQLTENIDEAVFWIIELEQLQILYVSPSYEQIWGHDCNSLYNNNQLWMEAIHPEDRPHVQNVVEQEKKGERHDIEYRIIRPDGSLRWIRDRGFGLKDAAGNPYRMVGIAEDITEQVQLVAREKAAREEAERSNRVKDEFLAILSHELRSPLNPILGWTQMFKTYQSDPRILQEGIDAIERSAKLLLELINDLLDVAKILRGKIVLNLTPVDLVTIIEAAIETVSASAKAKSIIIETHLDSNLQVDGDFARLQQIVWNILSNAVKFTPNGGRIEIKLERVENTAQIVVSDNGKGISPEFLPHVFEYFCQADGSITRKHGGLGLGLALVRHLVELHGGMVAANSSGINCGATFLVSLPSLITNSDNENSDGTELSLINKANLTGIKVLVVEDDPDNLKFLTMALECHHASVLGVTSAAEALSRFAEFVPDILLSDIAMPDTDGLTFIKSIRSRTPEQGGTIKAIALSAYAREIDREQALAAGYQVHLSKPIQINTLITTIFDLWS